jgi:superfamily II DNA or RNA helicase
MAIPAVPWSVRFEGGTLVLDGVDADSLPPGFAWDARIGRARASALAYRGLLEEARDAGIEVEDRARAYAELPELLHRAGRQPRTYQAEAIAAWTAARWRGVVVLPTGAGKSFVAEKCIAAARRSALVVVPTLDLVAQWYGNLRAAFGVDVGVIGGGRHEVEGLTVITYDSFSIHAHHLGSRFGMLVFDEVHHLPAPAYAAAASAFLAPLRLGLTATLERPDGRHDDLDALVGPVVYSRAIPELSGEFLAPYETEVIHVALGPEEQAEYTRLRGRYRSFVESRGIRVSAPGGWDRFIMESSRSKEGRAAFAAFNEARRIAHGTDRKLDVVRALVAQEWGRRTIIFTNDNDTALRISRMLLAPCITHRTDAKERRRYLDAFGSGVLNVLVTSRVLNEGVDIPAAEVAIVVSGTSTVREAVQRLGRILRPGAGKQAILYELVAEGTTEMQASERRREHDAYR